MNPEVLNTILNQSREEYGQSKDEVEKDIMRRSKLGETESAGTKDNMDMR